MTHAAPEERFRQAAEAEGGMAVSAGARVAQVRAAVDAGRALYIDLTDIPEDARPTVVAGIKELVERSSVRATQAGLDPAPGASAADS